MKKKAAFLLAFVMLASVPYSGALASDADVIISEDIAEDEVTDTSDLDFSEISVEEVEEIPAEAEAVTETEASGQTGEAETETVAETEAETSGEAVEPTTESAASAESETISEEASAELSTEVSLEADAAAEPEGTAETETSQTVSDESGSLSDDGIMVSSIEEVESVAETETDVQTVATTTVTELETNTIYSLADVIGSTQYFSVPSAGRMQIIIANSVNTSYTLYVYNTGLLSNYRKLSYETGIESVTFDYVVLPEAKQYSFEISGSTPNSEATLEIRFEAAGTYNGETEWNDSFDTANEIALNTAYFGTVSSDDKYDYYHFTLTSPSRVSFSDGSDESHYVTLYSEDSNGNTTRLYGNLTNWRLPAGSYFVVIGYNSGYRPYYLTVSATAESADAYEIEKNDLTSQANSKKTSTWDTGNINYYSSSDSGLCDVDWFSYSVTEKCYLTLELKVPRQSSGTVTATLYLLSGKELVEVAAITSGSDPYISSEKLFCKAGTYYVKVTGNSSSATWDYSVCLTKAKYTALTKLTLPTTKYIK
ncbi:MAG: hypothetical protein LUI07_09285, partial [Lachnospiraceae bacterium]|nr:hypothetical protein [Lachnospiraceae bacterium]